MQGYIYKIENKLNNKVYIGKTVRSVSERFTEHLKCRGKGQQPLYRAMNKYGKENFEVTELTACHMDELDDMERFYIELYDSYNKGYNATLGGDGRPRTDYDELAEKFINSDMPMVAYAKANGVKETTIRRALKYTGRHEEYISRHPEFNPIHAQKGVVMIDKDTLEELMSFESISSATKYLGVKNNGHIAAVLSGKRGVAYGHKWRLA